MSFFKKIKAFSYCIREAFQTNKTRYFNDRSAWGHIGAHSVVHSPNIVSGRENIFIGNRVNIDWNVTIYAVASKFVIKDNCTISVNCVIITDDHKPAIGERLKDKGNRNLVGSGVFVDEDVQIGANVILLGGTHVGRGSIIGAGSCLKGKTVPPYAIIVGNPGKLIGFKMTASEIIEHEKKLYAPQDRLSIEEINEVFQKYTRDRDAIKGYTSL